MPTLNDFSNNINSTIVARGQKLYRSGHIQSAKETIIGLWSATVKGTELYSVQIRLKENEILKVECNCPYNRSEYCKHVAAVLLHIKDSYISDPTSDPIQEIEEDNDTDPVSSILEGLEKEELINLINAFRSNNSAIDEIITLRHGAKTNNKEKDYRKVVKAVFAKAYRKNSFIHYNETFSLSKKSEPLIQQLQEWSEERNHHDVALLSFEIMLAISKAATHMDDSAGVMGDIFLTAKAYLSSATKSYNANDQKTLLKLLWKHHLDEGFTEYGLDGDLLEISIPLITTAPEQAQFLAEVDKGLAKVESKEWRRDHSYEYYAMMLLALYKHLGEDEKYEKHINKYIQYEKVRILKVDQLIASGQSSLAIQMCQEGIDIALKKDHHGTVADWKRKILDIAIIDNDKSEIRRLSLLLIKSHGSSKSEMYEVYKSTFLKKDWNKHLPEYINQLNALNINPSSVADILIKENKSSWILELFKNSDVSFHTLDNYLQYVSKDNSGFVVQKYKEEIDNLAAQQGRKIYTKIAKILLRLNNVTHGKAAVKEIINDFQLKYKKRPAMMEELKKKFPDMF